MSDETTGQPEAPQTVDQLAAARQAANEIVNALNARLREVMHGIDARSEGIADALSKGNAKLADRLRTERASLETELRDLPAAEALASRKLEEAERAYAEAIMPRLDEEMTALEQEVVTGFAALRAVCDRLTAKRAELLQNRAQCRDRFKRREQGALPHVGALSYEVWRLCTQHQGTPDSPLYD